MFGNRSEVNDQYNENNNVNNHENNHENKKDDFDSERNRNRNRISYVAKERSLGEHSFDNLSWSQRDPARMIDR